MKFNLNHTNQRGVAICLSITKKGGYLFIYNKEGWLFVYLKAIYEFSSSIVFLYSNFPSLLFRYLSLEKILRVCFFSCKKIYLEAKQNIQLFLYGKNSAQCRGFSLFNCLLKTLKRKKRFFLSSLRFFFFLPPCFQLRLPSSLFLFSLLPKSTFPRN